MHSFANLIDKRQIKTHIETVVKNNKPAHAYIISGEEGAGKKYTAKLFAKALLCEKLNKDKSQISFFDNDENEDTESGEFEVCCNCTACMQIEADTHADVKIIYPSKTMTIGVDDIREQIVTDIDLKPFSASRKIYIVPNAHEMTIQSQNALLKTLEEPPEYAIIFLLSNNNGMFLDTIMSRCIELPIFPVPEKIIRNYLTNDMGLTEYNAFIAASFCAGNIGKAIKISMDNVFEERLNKTTKLFYETINTGNEDYYKKTIGEIKSEVDEILLLSADDDEGKKTKKDEKNVLIKNSIPEFFDILLYIIRDIAIYKSSGDENKLILKNQRDTIVEIAKGIGFDKITKIKNKLDVTKNRIHANIKYDIVLEMFWMDIKEI